ncbi:hypothetical protein C6361_12750 [Plantactinospora sp. BC1]|uniref:hypothetical protein n=1 Tax=Plantactinospora sp. BC1 TaxID=2108470 RepID=UPI000D1518D9|nr:hypothetical protein [Plantactinospora sp. BC1]AVT30219.1 hypothetical protein C6361_12750 [Plantactinospora sp. BC1]
MTVKTWSLAGAARFAREARTGTATHMRTAEIARRWHKVKMMRAYEIHRANFGSRDAATLMLFGGLGYQPPYPAGWDEAADLVIGDEARHLTEAELYVVTPQMCDIVIAAAQSLGVEDLQLIDEEDLPSPTGLLVLPYPVLVRTVGGNLGDDRAFSWHTPANFTLPDPTNRDAMLMKPSVRVSVYHDTHGPVRPDSFLDLAAEARQAGTPLPPLILDAVRCLPFRAAEADPQAPARLARAAQAVDGAVRDAAEAMGQDESRVIGEYASGSQIEDADDTFTLRFLYAFWRLCEQRIAEVQHIETNHAARVIAERTGMSPEVRVIRLRQRAEQPHGGAKGRNWQHRWIVKMHKVRQWYPSEQRHKVIYRGPYIKGPDGKPLLDGETIRALVR